MEYYSAIVFTVLSVIVILFQFGLSLGMPWGAASMGGKFPGKYPPKMRVVALFNMIILSFFAVIVLSEAGIMFNQLQPISRVGIWVVLVYYAIGTVLNIITPSKIERIWAPVVALQLVACLIVAVH